MKKCLASSRRDLYRKRLRKAKSITIIQDASKGPQGGTSETNDFWTIYTGYLTRHQIQRRRTLFVPTPQNCPIPLRYIDCRRKTETDLEDLSERYINDFWSHTADDNDPHKQLDEP